MCNYVQENEFSASINDSNAKIFHSGVTYTEIVIVFRGLKLRDS